MRRFLEQMPDGLDMISQSLQSRVRLTQAMVFVAKEVPDPLVQNFLFSSRKSISVFLWRTH